ncbi:MAG: TlyA family RNA methyltransferase [Clostridia bacterium]|nr:TlyA family RNA methyltransferase [Clostridia bacterium]
MSEDGKLRVDQALCLRGLAASRERAQALIAAGLVFAGGAAVKKPSQKVGEETVLEVRGEACPYVSRGGFKLEKALLSFGVNPDGAVAIDVGASTGGFTDVLLQNGAKLVYAVDVGTAQLDPKLDGDSRVIKMEQTNARTLSRDMFSPAPSLAVMDVSFISIRKILPALRDVLGENGRVISLVKPQFEAGREALGKKGVVSNPAVHERVLRDVAAFAPECGWRVRKFDFSPISGTQGNLEFLADFIPDDGKTISPGPQEIRALVKLAHAGVRKGNG